jgi:TrmH family RNA methyltransferase
VPSPLGAHASKAGAVRDLLAPKGRREQGRFLFEGPTLLAEALRSGAPVSEIFVTRAALQNNADVAEFEARGSAVYVVDERTAAKISDLETPTGLVAVAPIAVRPLESLLPGARLVLALAALSDPGNAGTLLRSAEAFGASAAVFGSDGVDPHHPKVVRAAMGTIFRLPLATADPETLGAAARAAGLEMIGLEASGEPLDAEPWARPCVVVVGHERRGLGPWGPLCARKVAIPMRSPTESVNAAVAGSIALYEAGKRHLG